MAVRKGLQGEQLEKALAKYKGLQEVEMKTAESERALFDWTSKQNLHCISEYANWCCRYWRKFLPY